ncbi:MAG: DUF3141 domain-containing protein [Alphaproteobacteria bacterium]|nr:DUF3141 domain-containing protein [Alphaproteobacteria bacterium]
MSTDNPQPKPDIRNMIPGAFMMPGTVFFQAIEFWTDAFQRSVLFLDVLRERGNIHFKQLENPAPTVLFFDHEEILNGQDLLEPVNYMLFRILPPDGLPVDPTKRPFIIFDPRAGHGPGIGGMKPDSEIGLAMRAGHPCYFVGFLPYPTPTQTTEDVCRAEAVFVAKVIELHPKADKPCLIGNCQAGWQIAMMSATNPDLVGVLILAGAPISYWAGVHGKNPMRYVGGMTGGSWTTSLSSDIGNGLFDGATLVQNFENSNPANTLWKKNYSLYSKVDTEAPRFLEFERWWGAPVLLNREEMQFIVDELFIGNHLSAAKIHTSGGLRIDLRNIKSPIVVFCSNADDITPPQQALDWILDLYNSEDEIVANGQTIIYTVHQTIGHLGIFVSGSVAVKEHDKFIQNIDMIETLPPGLYEAIFTEKEADTLNPELVSGKYILRFDRRRLDDIRAFGCNDAEDNLRFEAVSRISENIQGMYHTFLSPTVRSLVTDKTAELLRRMNPIRSRFEVFSNRNPLLSQIGPLAEAVKANRLPVSQDNVFWAMQEAFSKQIISALDSYREARDEFTEKLFIQIYGSPLIQAMIGLRTVRPYSVRHIGRDMDRERTIHQKLEELQNQVEAGGLAEAMARGLIYVSRGSNSMDEREFVMLRKLRSESKLFPQMPRDEYKAMARQQYMMLMLDEERALNAMPTLLRSGRGSGSEVISAIRSVIEAAGKPTDNEYRRLKKLEKLLT